MRHTTAFLLVLVGIVAWVISKSDIKLVATHEVHVRLDVLGLQLDRFPAVGHTFGKLFQLEVSLSSVREVGLKNVR